jgi:hypothetical protein
LVPSEDIVISVVPQNPHLLQRTLSEKLTSSPVQSPPLNQRSQPYELPFTPTLLLEFIDKHLPKPKEDIPIGRLVVPPFRATASKLHHWIQENTGQNEVRHFHEKRSSNIWNWTKVNSELFEQPPHHQYLSVGTYLILTNPDSL